MTTLPVPRRGGALADDDVAAAAVSRIAAAAAAAAPTPQCPWILESLFPPKLFLVGLPRVCFSARCLRFSAVMADVSLCSGIQFSSVFIRYIRVVRPVRRFVPISVGLFLDLVLSYFRFNSSATQLNQTNKRIFSCVLWRKKPGAIYGPREVQWRGKKRKRKRKRERERERELDGEGC